MTPTYLYKQSPMTSGCDPDSEIPNETSKKEAWQGTLLTTQRFHHSHVSTLLYKCLTMSLESGCLFFNLQHVSWHTLWLIDPVWWLCGWLKRSLSPVIAFSEVIKLTLIMLCWLCVSYSGRSQILAGSHEAWFWSAVNGADHWRSLRPFTPS